MKTTMKERGDRKTVEMQPPEYVPPGPIVIAGEKSAFLGVPEAERKSGYVYDVESWVQLCKAEELVGQERKKGETWSGKHGEVVRKMMVWP